MGEILTGNNWEVHRGFLSPSTAHELGMLAIQVIVKFEGHIVSLPATDRTSRVHTYLVEIGPSTIMPPEMRPLVRLHELASDYVGLEREYFSLLVYEPDGKLFKHRDRLPEPTIALGLLGTASCVLKDPLTKTKHGFILQPGDALITNNPYQQRQRPLHQLTNISKGPRVSYVG